MTAGNFELEVLGIYGRRELCTHGSGARPVSDVPYQPVDAADVRRSAVFGARQDNEFAVRTAACVQWSALVDVDAALLSSFLCVALLLDGPPAAFNARIRREHQLLVTEGNKIRVALPRFLEQRRALVHQHCPLIRQLIELVLRLSEPDNAFVNKCDFICKIVTIKAALFRLLLSLNDVALMTFTQILAQ